MDLKLSYESGLPKVGRASQLYQHGFCIRIGLVINTYYGSFFTRQSDLLALANVNPDHSFAVVLSVEETLMYPLACIQTALLHTNHAGERRIRVLTMALPVSSNPMEIFSQCDAGTIANLLSKQAMELIPKQKLEGARDMLFTRTIEIYSAQKALLASNSSSPHIVSSESMKAFAALILGCLKSVRGSAY
jgi:protein transport protein SEC24